ncbi:unnamed protein product [Ixodes pacificus]
MLLHPATIGCFLLKLRHPCSKGTFPRPKIANSSLTPQNERQVAQVTGQYEGSAIDSQDKPDERQPIRWPTESNPNPVFLVWAGGPVRLYASAMALSTLKGGPFLSSLCWPAAALYLRCIKPKLNALPRAF